MIESDLSTELLDQMRKEILDVVAKYVEIDFEEGSSKSRDRRSHDRISCKPTNKKNYDWSNQT